MQNINHSVSVRFPPLSAFIDFNKCGNNNGVPPPLTPVLSSRNVLWHDKVWAVNEEQWQQIVLCRLTTVKRKRNECGRGGCYTEPWRIQALGSQGEGKEHSYQERQQATHRDGTRGAVQELALTAYNMPHTGPGNLYVWHHLKSSVTWRVGISISPSQRPAKRKGFIPDGTLSKRLRLIPSVGLWTPKFSLSSWYKAAASYAWWGHARNLKEGRQSSREDWHQHHGHRGVLKTGPEWLCINHLNSSLLPVVANWRCLVCLSDFLQCIHSTNKYFLSMTMCQTVL